jgi:hypothetical protein
LQDDKAPVAAETVPLLGLARPVLDLQCRRPVPASGYAAPVLPLAAQGSR